MGMRCYICHYACTYRCKANDSMSIIIGENCHRYRTLATEASPAHWVQQPKVKGLIQFWSVIIYNLYGNHEGTLPRGEDQGGVPGVK